MAVSGKLKTSSLCKINLQALVSFSYLYQNIILQSNQQQYESILALSPYWYLHLQKLITWCSDVMSQGAVIFSVCNLRSPYKSLPGECERVRLDLQQFLYIKKPSDTTPKVPPPPDNNNVIFTIHNFLFLCFGYN